MEDQKKTLEPVVVVSDAWHLSRAKAYSDAATIVASAQLDPDVSLDDFAAQILQQLQAEAGSSMKAWMRNNGILKPDHDVVVEFDDAKSIPVVEWPADGTRGHSIVDLPADEGADMAMTVPFRPVQLSTLDADRVEVKLHDHYHAATAALAEVLRCAHQSATSAFQVHDPRAGWNRLQSVITTFRQIARFGLAKLEDEDYIGWRQPALPNGIEISNAASLICQVAASVRALCSISAHLMAAWLQRLANRAEAFPSGERERFFMDELGKACENVESVLHGLNASLARANWNRDGEFQAMVIFRPIPQSIPVLVVLSKDDTMVVPMKPRRKQAKK